MQHNSTEEQAQRVLVLGMAEDGLQGLADASRNAIESADLLCGGERHLALISQLDAERLVIKSPLGPVLERMSQAHADKKRVVVLASGDPLCFGIGPLLVDRLGADRVEIVPSLSAAQLAFARVGEPWQEARVLSAHGRPLEPVIGPVLSARRSAILTDEHNSPSQIAKALAECGLENCRVVIAERLGGSQEEVVETDLHGALGYQADPLNVMLILRTPDAKLLQPRSGLPDSCYEHRNGMITKAEVRAVSLSLLAITRGDIVWDIGAGCGSVALEAASFVDSGFVYAIERDVAQCAYIKDNLKRHSGPVRVIEDEAPAALRQAPDPDAVFLGGSGGQLDAQLGAITQRLRPGGRLVANFARLANLEESRQFVQQLGWTAQVVQIQINRGTEDGRLSALNPVHILSTRKPDSSPEP